MRGRREREPPREGDWLLPREMGTQAESTKGTRLPAPRERAAQTAFWPFRSEASILEEKQLPKQLAPPSCGFLCCTNRAHSPRRTVTGQVPRGLPGCELGAWALSSESKGCVLSGLLGEVTDAPGFHSGRSLGLVSGKLRDPPCSPEPLSNTPLRMEWTKPLTSDQQRTAAARAGHSLSPRSARPADRAVPQEQAARRFSCRNQRRPAGCKMAAQGL
nr:uncharacterized protein LOC114089703 [Marmota flaviventris]